MNLFRWFAKIIFLLLLSYTNGMAGDYIVPPSLQNTIERVRGMKQKNAAAKDIASVVTQTVVNRLTFLNHTKNRISTDYKIEKKLKLFNAWRDKGDMVDETFSAAVWAWENRVGQCNESASTAYHILVMAFESTDEIVTVVKGDHRFVVLGDVKNLPPSFSADDLSKLDNTYIVDPWDNVSFSSKDLSFFDWFQHGNGTKLPGTRTPTAEHKGCYFGIPPKNRINGCPSHENLYFRMIKRDPNVTPCGSSEAQDTNFIKKNITNGWPGVKNTLLNIKNGCMVFQIPKRTKS